MSSAREKIGNGKPIIPVTTIDHPNDQTLPGMTLLFDLSAVTNLIEGSAIDRDLYLIGCRAEYVRYKPATNCLVAYKATWRRGSTGDEIESRHFGKSYLAEDYAAAVLKIQRDGMVAPAKFDPLICLKDESTIIYHCQYDRELRAFETIANPRKLNRILHEILSDYPRTEWRISDKKLTVSIIRFKPEKRAVVRVTTRVTHKQSGRREQLTLYLRCYCDSRGSDLYNLMNRLHGELSGRNNMPLVARPYAYLEDMNLLFMAEVKGEELLPLLSADIGKDVIIRTAESLAQLHRLENVELPGRTANDILSAAATTTRSLSYLLPELGTELNAVVDALKSTKAVFEQGGKKFVHGDFYYDQILVQPGRIAILDFDQSYIGDSLNDVANFVAHLKLLQISGLVKNSADLERLFIAAYESGAGVSIDRTRLRIWKAYCLIMLSVSPFRKVYRDWKQQSLEIVKECGSLLQ